MQITSLWSLHRRLNLKHFLSFDKVSTKSYSAVFTLAWVFALLYQLLSPVLKIRSKDHWPLKEYHFLNKIKAAWMLPSATQFLHHLQTLFFLTIVQLPIIWLGLIVLHLFTARSSNDAIFCICLAFFPYMVYLCSKSLWMVIHSLGWKPSVPVINYTGRISSVCNYSKTHIPNLRLQILIWLWFVL